MKLQKQPNRWSCLPTSFAILLNIDVSNIFDFLGHDGSDILWPDLDDPYCRRSFHLQEMVNYCLSTNHCVTTVTPKLGLVPSGSDDVHVYENILFPHYLHYYNGVMSGVTELDKPHAVVRYSREIFDPTSGELLEGEFSVNLYHIVHKLM